MSYKGFFQNFVYDLVGICYFEYRFGKYFEDLGDFRIILGSNYFQELCEYFSKRENVLIRTFSVKRKIIR